MVEKVAPDADFGDELTPEQLAAAAATTADANEPKMTDEEVAAAVAAMADGDKDDTNPKDDKPKAKAKAKSDDEYDDDNLIPRGRFNEAVGKERSRADALAAELKKLKSGTAPAVATPPTGPTIDDEITESAVKVRKLRKDWQTAILDNDKDAAGTYLAAMNDEEDRLSDMRLERVTQVTRATTNEDQSYTRALTALETEFPQLVFTNADYDADLMARMTRLHTGLMNSGLSLTEALDEAAEVYLTPLREAAKKAAPPVKDAKENKEDDLRSRSKDALAKIIDGQPPDIDALDGDRSHTEDPILKPSRMTLKQHAKLSEDQKALLRGDYL